MVVWLISTSYIFAQHWLSLRLCLLICSRGMHYPLAMWHRLDPYQSIRFYYFLYEIIPYLSRAQMYVDSSNWIGRIKNRHILSFLIELDNTYRVGNVHLMELYQFEFLDICTFLSRSSAIAKYISMIRQFHNRTCLKENNSKVLKSILYVIRYGK